LNLAIYRCDYVLQTQWRCASNLISDLAVTALPGDELRYSKHDPHWSPVMEEISKIVSFRFGLFV